MKILERQAARDAMAQLFADAGIDASTIHTLVNEVIGEKVNKAVRHYLDQEGIKLDDLVDKEVQRVIRDSLRSQVEAKVRETLRYVTVRVEADINGGGA